MRLAYPWFLLLLLLLPLWLKALARRRQARKTGLRFSTVGHLRKIPPAPSIRFRNAPLFLRTATMALLIIALARPQTGHGYRYISRYGIDIMLALDISTSMNITDVKPSRLEAAKNAITNFISHRSNDRIGLILFAGTSFTRCPLTLDYNVLSAFIKPVKSGMVEDGTAIGMAIANGVNRLKESKAKSKILVLLTDGVNNRGLIDPRSAIDLAVSQKIKVYTIGLGKPGTFYMEVPDPLFGSRKVPVRSEIDEALLKEIAKKTGARYFAARNEKELGEIYEAIDKLEKSEVKSRIFYEYTEEFGYAATLALIFLLAEWLASAHFLRRLPE